MNGTFQEIINARSEHNSPINIINHPRSHHCLSRKYPSQQLDLQTSRVPQPWTAWLLSPVHPSVQPSSSADHRPWTSSFFSRQQPYLPMQKQQDASSYNSQARQMSCLRPCSLPGSLKTVFNCTQDVETSIISIQRAKPRACRAPGFISTLRVDIMSVLSLSLPCRPKPRAC